MFLKQKKGNLVAQFVVLLVIAVVLIFVVSSFGSKIWQAFFPSADKSTMKSFDAVFNVFNAKAASLKDYDSTTMNIYLKEGYRMIFFDKDTIECTIFKTTVAPGTTLPVTQTGTESYYMPKICDNKKQCLCLYKDKPVADINKRDSNVAKCYPMEKITIDKNYFDLNNEACSEGTGTKYGSYMFIKRQVYPENVGYVYVIKSNDSNKELDANWSIPVCKATTSSNPCYGKRDQDIVNAINQTSLDTIYKYCKNKEGVAYKSLGVKCEYPQGGEDCDPDCKYGDVKASCGTTYRSCEDYNQLKSKIDSSTTVEYISIDDDYKTYALCQNDNSFCDVNKGLGCSIKTWDIYACRDSESGGVTGSNDDCTPPWSYADSDLKDTDCQSKFIEDLENEIFLDTGLVSFINSYDESNPKCKAYMDKYFFEKQPMMKCKEGNSTQCEKFVKDMDKTWSKNYDCDLKFIQNGQMYWLTHYDSSNADCESKVKALFTVVSFCKTA